MLQKSWGAPFTSPQALVIHHMISEVKVSIFSGQIIIISNTRNKRNKSWSLYSVVFVCFMFQIIYHSLPGQKTKWSNKTEGELHMGPKWNIYIYTPLNYLCMYIYIYNLATPFKGKSSKTSWEVLWWWEHTMLVGGKYSLKLYFFGGRILADCSHVVLKILKAPNNSHQPSNWPRILEPQTTQGFDHENC